MIFEAPTPFEDALKSVTESGLLPTSLSSADLRGLSSDLKRRAIFSARVEQASILQTLQDAVAELASGDVVGSSFTRAKAQLLKAVKATGYTPNPDDEGGLKDLTSDARLQLMVETNVAQAQGFGAHLSGLDPVALEVNPGLELVRSGSPETPRNWEARWDSALQATTREGATAGDRMCALKGHPVWQALGDGAGGYEDTLGNPYPPFAFLSSMITIPLSRDECEALGILSPGETNPGEETPGINAAMEADASRFAPALRAALAANPELTVEGGVLALR